MRKKYGLKKVFTFIMAVTIIASSLTFMPGGTIKALANPVTDVYPSVTLGVAGISNPAEPTSSSDLWQGNYVYYGNYYQDQITADVKQKLKWRVLDKNSSADISADAQDSMLLMSDKVLDQVLFNEHTMDGYEWSASNIKNWLNSEVYVGSYTAGGFLRNAFSDREIKGMNNSYGGYDSSELMLTSPKIAEDTSEQVKVFLLSKAELLNTKYGFTSSSSSNEKTRTLAVTDFAANKAVNSSAGYPLYWTRSNIFGLITVVYYNGLMNTSHAVNFVDTDRNCTTGVAPAFQLNNSKIILSSAAEDGKSSAIIADFSSLPGVFNQTSKVREWKLTMSDIYDAADNSSGQRLTLDSVERIGNTNSVIIEYSNATTGSNQYISAIITNKAGDEVLSYGKLASSYSAASGELTITLPSDFFQNGYRLKIFSEQDNGNYKTDFAGELLDSNLEASTNANLSSLLLYNSEDGLKAAAPAFDSTVTEYETVVDYGVTAIKITAALSDVNASMTLKKGDGNASALGHNATTEVALDVGDNVFTIEVQAEDQEITKTYVLTVKRPDSYTASYGMKLEDITLPSGYAWVSPETSVGSITETGRKFPVNYTFEGVQLTAEFLVLVEKATPSYTMPSGLTAVYGDTLADVTLPEGFVWKLAETTTVGNAGGNYFKAVYTPADTTNYKTVEVNVEIQVEKAAPSYTVPSGLTAVYGDTLADVILPEGFTWKLAASTSVGNVGGNYFTAIYTPTDTANYKTAEVNVEIQVEKAAPSHTAPSGLTAVYGDTLADVTLPEGFAWKLAASTSVGNAGSNYFTAIYTPTDTANCKTVEVNVEIQVEKAVPNYTAPSGLTAVYGDTLADVTLPEGFTWKSAANTSVGNVGTNNFTVIYTPSDTANYKTAECTVSIKVSAPAISEPKKGTQFTSGSYTYKIINPRTNGSGTVMLTGFAKGKSQSNVKVPSTRTYQGITYKVTEIGTKAFFRNTKIKTAAIGNNVTKIGKGAFQQCTKLKTVKIGDKVRTLGNLAFYKCTSLKKVTIGTGLTKIGKHVFCHNKNLRTIIIKSKKLSSVGEHNLLGARNLKIKVPAKKVKAYQKLFKKQGKNTNVVITK